MPILFELQSHGRSTAVDGTRPRTGRDHEQKVKSRGLDTSHCRHCLPVGGGQWSLPARVLHHVTTPPPWIIISLPLSAHRLVRAGCHGTIPTHHVRAVNFNLTESLSFWKIKFTALFSLLQKPKSFQNPIAPPARPNTGKRSDLCPRAVTPFLYGFALTSREWAAHDWPTPAGSSWSLQIAQAAGGMWREVV
jgi:hypothetical protein